MQDLSSIVVLHLHRSPQLQATTSNAASVTSCSMSYNSVLQGSVQYESQDITDKVKTLCLPARLESTLDQGVTTVRFGITVRLDFGKKYDTELRTEFLEKVRYGTEIRYYIFRTVPYSFRTPVTHVLHFCFQVLHFSF